ncbi:MAG: hypothetical protein IJ623_05150 [Bacteroidales bacterium]|nr:hypothetical protein [Bacteroidales bacterium]
MLLDLLQAGSPPVGKNLARFTPSRHKLNQKQTMSFNKHDIDRDACQLFSAQASKG